MVNKAQISKAIKCVSAANQNAIRLSYFETADGLYGLQDVMRDAAKDAKGDTKDTLEEAFAEVTYAIKKIESLGLGEWI